MKLIRTVNDTIDEVTVFFSRLNSIIPAQRKNLPVDILQQNRRQYQERRRTAR